MYVHLVYQRIAAFLCICTDVHVRMLQNPLCVPAMYMKCQNTMYTCTYTCTAVSTLYTI